MPSVHEERRGMISPAVLIAGILGGTYLGRTLEHLLSEATLWIVFAAILI
jgi:hypothetical protein